MFVYLNLRKITISDIMRVQTVLLFWAVENDISSTVQYFSLQFRQTVSGNDKKEEYEKNYYLTLLLFDKTELFDLCSVLLK